MDEESQVRGCYNRTFICTPANQETVSVGKDASKQNIQNMKANVKYKQQQLSNNYSNHVVYLQVTIIRDKMINYQAHDLHLKPISHCVAVSIQETASQLTDELPVLIVCNKVTVKNADYQAHS